MRRAFLPISKVLAFRYGEQRREEQSFESKWGTLQGGRPANSFAIAPTNRLRIPFVQFSGKFVQVDRSCWIEVALAMLASIVHERPLWPLDHRHTCHRDYGQKTDPD